MAHFDRFDILDAHKLYNRFHHNGPGSKEYARMCRIMKHIGLDRHRLSKLEDLSENALEIYLNLCDASEYTIDHPIANASDHIWTKSLFLMWAGDFSTTKVYVWADSFDVAFEVLTEWLDDNAPGRLVSYAEETATLDEYRREHGISDEKWLDMQQAGDPAYEVYQAIEEENGWTLIGHTTLDRGGHIPSYEWGGDDVSGEEFERVKLASMKEGLES
jgi:hypothetical protein